MRNLLLLQLVVLAAPALGTIRTVQDACEILVGQLNPDTDSARSDADRLELGKQRFEAVAFLKDRGTGKILANGGRAFKIPLEDLEGLTEAFRADYLSAGRPGAKGASPTAPGNVLHQGDHDAYDAKFGVLMKSGTGVDSADVRLAQAAHDVGKAYLDAPIAAYVKAKREGRTAAGGLNAFLHEYVLAHEEHSIARIFKVVTKHLESRNVDPDSPAGKELVNEYSLQIIEAIRQHNGVDVTGNLKEKYPSLTDDEIKTVMGSWWAAKYAIYAETMGLPKTKYGDNVSALAEVLNYYDRATLTADGAPEKLGAQNLSEMSIGIPWIHESMVKAAQDNAPLLKAQMDKLRKFAGDSEQGRRDLRQIDLEVRESNSKLERLGFALKEMNDPVLLKRLGVSESELAWDKPGKAAAGEKVFVYVRLPQLPGPGSAPVVRVEDSTNLAGWHRVDATVPTSPITQKWTSKGWETVEDLSEGNPAVQVARLARSAGLWGQK